MGSCESIPEYQDSTKIPLIQKIRYENRCIPLREDAQRADQILDDTGMLISSDILICKQDWFDNGKINDKDSALYCNNDPTLQNLKDNGAYPGGFNSNCLIYDDLSISNDLTNRLDSCRGTRIVPFLFRNELMIKNKAPLNKKPNDNDVNNFIQKNKDLINDTCKLISDEWAPNTHYNDFIGIHYLFGPSDKYDYGYNKYPTVDNQNPADGGGCYTIGDTTNYQSSSIRCSRTRYDGDGIACCLKNWDKNGGIWGLNYDSSPINGVITYKEDCFQPVGNNTDDYNIKRTCSPWLSSPTSTQCKDKLMPYCSGKDFGRGEKFWLRERWINPNPYQSTEISSCDYLMSNLLSTNQSQNNTVAASIISSIVPLLELSTNNILSIADSVDAIMWNKIQNYCSATPGLCDDALYRYCTRFTSDQVLRSENLRNICGCFLPAEQYNIGVYNIKPECSPLCLSSKIKPGNLGSGTFKGCTESTCIINNLAIDVINSNSSIDISQYCGGCSSSSGACTCIIDNESIEQINSSGKIILDQSCTLKQCSTKDEDGNTIVIPCPEDNPILSTTTVSTWRRIIYVIGGLIVILIILVFLILFG